MDPSNCSQCGSDIRLIQINLTQAVYLCPNVKCPSLFNNPNSRLSLVERDFRKMNEEVVLGKETQPVASAFSNSQLHSDKDYLDNLLSECGSMEMTEDDIQAMDSVFELLQNF